MHTWVRMHAHTRTRTQTHKHAPVSVGRIRAVPVPCRLSATRVQRCHTHLPTEQTHPLDWNNRIKIRAERGRERETVPLSSLFPPSLTPCPTSPSKCYPTSTPKREKNKTKEKKKTQKTSALTLEVLDWLAVASAAPFTIVAGRNTHKHNHAQTVCKRKKKNRHFW